MKQILLIISFSILILTACTNEDKTSQASVQNEVKTEVNQEQKSNTEIKIDTESQIKTVDSNEIIVSDEVKNADLSVLVIGDSLSAGYGIILEKSWVNLLKNDLESLGKSVAITNGSISGETTGGGLARLDDLIARSEPDIVIIELGGNDGLRGYPVKTIRNNLTTMIEKSRAVGAKVLLCGIMIPPNYGDRYAKAFADLYPSLANELNVPLVPFILEGVALNDEMMQDDGIHPNELGQPVIRDNVMEHLSLLLDTQNKTIPKQSFYTDGWPGEGIPVLSYGKNNITFCPNPVEDKSCSQASVNVSSKFNLVLTDNKFVEATRYLTKQPVILRANKDFSIENFQTGTLKIKLGDELVWYQYAAEGTHYVGINGNIIELDFYQYEDHLDGLEKSPVVEWWVKIKNKGWVLVDENNFTFHDREF